jgi:hypothetical protein
MLGMEGDIKEPYDRLEPLFAPCSQDKPLVDYLNHDWKPFPEPVATDCPSADLRLVMLHDSFGKGLRPYLSAHFKRSVYVWQHNLSGEMFKKVILKEHPDIVIEEIVERMIPYMKCGPEFEP